MGEKHRKLNRQKAHRVVLQDEIMKASVHYRYSIPHSAHTLYLRVVYDFYNTKQLLAHIVFSSVSF